jgi:hypothetical protein
MAAAKLGWLGQHPEWFLRAQVIRLLSTDCWGTDACKICLISELAKLVAHYLPETVVLAVPWLRLRSSASATTSPTYSRAGPEIVGGAWRMASDTWSSDAAVTADLFEATSVNYLNTEVIGLSSLDMRSADWPTVNRESAIDNKRRIAYLLHTYEQDGASKLKLVALDLVTGRCWRTAEHPSVIDSSFGVSALVLRDSLWIIGNHATNNMSTARYNDDLVSVRYDLLCNNWDNFTYRHVLNGVKNVWFPAVVQISRNRAMISGGFTCDPILGTRKYFKRCLLLEETTVLGQHSLSVLKHDIPNLKTGRAQHKMAFVPEANSVVAVEGTHDGFGVPGSNDRVYNNWTKGAEILSLAPLTIDRTTTHTNEKETCSWSWHQLPSVPSYLAFGNSVVGIGDSVIVVGTSPALRLRVCGNCANNACDRARQHNLQYQMWQPLISLPQPYSSEITMSYLWIRDDYLF